MEPYRESPLHGLTCGGLSLFRKIGLCAFSVEPLMTGLAFDGFGIQTLLHLESNGIEDGTVSRKIEHLLVRKPAMPDRSLAVDIRELQGAFLFRATRKDGVVATVFRSAESYEVNFSIKNCAVQSVADCAVLFIPFFKPGIFQIEIPGERHLIQAQQLIRFDSASIHHRTSPERQEVPFTLFAWLKLSPITVKSPISLFFFVRFYHLSSKKGHP